MIVRQQKIYLVTGGRTLQGNQLVSDCRGWFRARSFEWLCVSNCVACKTERHARRQFKRARKNTGAQIYVHQRGKEPYVLAWK